MSLTSISDTFRSKTAAVTLGGLVAVSALVFSEKAGARDAQAAVIEPPTMADCRTLVGNLQAMKDCMREVIQYDKAQLDEQAEQADARLADARERRLNAEGQYETLDARSRKIDKRLEHIAEEQARLAQERKRLERRDTWYGEQIADVDDALAAREQRLAEIDERMGEINSDLRTLCGMAPDEPACDRL